MPDSTLLARRGCGAWLSFRWNASGARSDARARRADVRAAVRRLGRRRDQGRDAAGRRRTALGGARDGPDFQNLHRNKRSHDARPQDARRARRILKSWSRSADVLVENFRPRRQAPARHRLRDAARRSTRASSTAASRASARTGPYAERPGFDQIAQGMGGLMSITGLPGQGPVRVGIPVADLTAGICLARMGILIALLEREVSGEGQWVQTSLLAGADRRCWTSRRRAGSMDGEVPGQAGNDHPTAIPTGVFQTARRPHQHRRRRASRSSGGSARRSARRAAAGRALRHARASARRTASALNAADRQSPTAAAQRRVDRELNARRRALGPDLPHRRDVRRPAGAAPGDGARGARTRASARCKLVGQPLTLSRTPGR